MQEVKIYTKLISKFIQYFNLIVNEKHHLHRLLVIFTIKLPKFERNRSLLRGTSCFIRT
ncbi:hypothetical protein CCAND95_640002 [Capnocytophaga canis]|nr:hypothetical protein CCAND95_640002 [Capnocytophaga canis]